MSTLYTPDELRSLIGSPTKDPREPGAISDLELSNLIEIHRQMLENLVLRRLDEQTAAGQLPASPDIFSPVQVSLTSGDLYASGAVPALYYPFSPFAATGRVQGTSYSYQQDPLLETEQVGFFTRRRFRFEGNKVIVIPRGTTTINVPLATKEDINNRLGSDLVAKMNDQLLIKARRMLEQKIKEGTRLEGEDYIMGDGDQ